MKKILLIICFALIWSSYSVQGDTLRIQGDMVDEISNQFRNANTKELSKYFSTTVNLSLLNNENVYSSAQTEIILASFFRSHPPQKVKIIHRLDNHTNYRHAVLLLNTAKGDYRVAFSLKGTDKQLQLIEIRIEESN